MSIAIVLLLFVFVIGLCIGSFLNVVILRALSGESIAFPASKCPKCQKPLKWWHNIPVLSYLFLRGKCAFCKAHISIQYPIIELLTGIIFTFIFMRYGISFDTLFMWAVSALLIVLAGTDIKEKVVFDVHAYSLIGVAAAYSVYIIIFSHIHNLGNMTWLYNPLANSILGAIVAALIMEACARLGYLFVGSRAFGEGDTLIAAGLGALFGWYQFLFVLALSVLFQVVVFIPIFIKDLIKNKEWKTLTVFGSFCIYAVVFYLFRNMPEKIYLFGAIILAALGIIACILILKGLKENPQSRTYQPFGPAMVAAAFFLMFLQMLLS